ncbi:lymphocyte activation gene 3 protein-like isoform X2 [Amphiprion ocellaris]|uniref:lymphocyte activation gene 3 protein-like isoform X2 n=1 Tax=Amphiprion ocellaris TaxID=80972 RepID=UPI000C30817B|nr:lymphocyte activation gene 3 protein-like isoform X2 [Amphiprion ocellaris]
MRLPELLCGGIFLFFFISDVRPEKVEVLVAAGSQAVLPCKCRSLSSDSAIIWSKERGGTVWRKQRSGLQYRGSSWAQKGTQRVQCPHQQFERGDFSLQIDAVTKEDGGTYTCMVDVGRWVTQSVVTLRVLTGILQPSREDARLYAAVGSAASLPCIFSPGLKPSESLWEKLKPTSLFRSAVDRLPASFSSSSSPAQLPWDKSARLDPVGLEDEGRYRCSGTVEGQRLARNMKLIVAQIVQTKEKGSVTLSCQLSDSSDVTKYDWVQTTSDPNGTESVRSVLKGKTVRISPESEQNQWTCRFYGKQGVLGNITHQAQLIGGLTGPGKSSVPSRNTPTVVGLSLLLLVLLLVLAQMYKNHQRRKRIFQYPALETMVHNISNEREEKNRNRARK